MERAREAGHARSIGVSNFSVDELQQLLAEAEVEEGGQSRMFPMAKQTGAPNVRFIRHWPFWVRKSAQADCGGEQPRVAGKLDTPRGLGCR